MVALGDRLTVTLPVVAIQPAADVNVNVATPAVIPMTRPEAEIVATGMLLLTHVPPTFGIS